MLSTLPREDKCLGMLVVGALAFAMVMIAFPRNDLPSTSRIAGNREPLPEDQSQTTEKPGSSMMMPPDDVMAIAMRHVREKNHALPDDYEVNMRRSPAGGAWLIEFIPTSRQHTQHLYVTVGDDGTFSAFGGR
ncbi:MAG: hypothetical protein K1X57_07660 [Gemmataceae bacterium]|nr:hypothetical protein [Gemmataceae bacterium]